MMHMLDLYPQQVVRTGIQEVWRRSPVSLETCGTPLSWKQWGYTDKQLQMHLRPGAALARHQHQYQVHRDPGGVEARIPRIRKEDRIPVHSAPAGISRRPRGRGP